MTPKKRQQLMFGILIGSVLFGLVMKPWQRHRPVVVDALPEAAIVDSTAIAVASTAINIDYEAEWPARDPFKQPNASSSSHVSVVETVSFGTPAFSLQGIMSVGGQPVCVIDGVSRIVGASVGGWRVEKIEAQGVWVSQGGERHYVPLQ